MTECQLTQLNNSWLETLSLEMRITGTGTPTLWKHIQTHSSSSSPSPSGERNQTSWSSENAGEDSCLSIDKSFLQGVELSQGCTSCLSLYQLFLERSFIKTEELRTVQKKMLSRLKSGTQRPEDSCQKEPLFSRAQLRTPSHILLTCMAEVPGPPLIFSTSCLMSQSHSWEKLMVRSTILDNNQSSSISKQMFQLRNKSA